MLPPQDAGPAIRDLEQTRPTGTRAKPGLGDAIHAVTLSDRRGPRRTGAGPPIWRRLGRLVFRLRAAPNRMFCRRDESSRGVSASKDYGPSGSSLTLRTGHPPPFHSNVLKQPLSCGIVSGSPSPASKASSTWRFTASWLTTVTEPPRQRRAISDSPLTARSATADRG